MLLPQTQDSPATANGLWEWVVSVNTLHALQGSCASVWQAHIAASSPPLFVGQCLQLGSVKTIIQGTMGRLRPPASVSLGP